jgi:hypothetical protein
MKNNYFYLSPIILLVWGVFSFLYIPIIPIASGYGWDGIFYGRVALDFQNMIGEIDSYHAGRIFPGVLIHYFFLLFKLPLTLKSALLAFKLYNLIISVCSASIWVRISRFLNLNAKNSWIGFICLFITYPVLNWYFYYPALTDGTTLLIGLCLIHCYLKMNYFWLFMATIVSFFSWPTGIIMCMSIFVYRNEKNVFWNNKNYVKLKFLTIIILLTPLLILVLGLSNLESISSLILELDLKNKMFNKITSINKVIKYNWFSLLSSLLLVAYYLCTFWFILKDFDFQRFFRFHLKKQMIFKMFVTCTVLFSLIMLKKFITNPLLPTVTALKGYAYPVIRLSTRFPLQFIVSHIAFWGPSIFLLIFFVKKIVNYLKSTNLAIIIGLLFAIILSINAESRAITNFYPFFIFILVQVVDFNGIRNSKYFILALITISLIYSKVWLLISLPASVFPSAPVQNLYEFPMQWYFMNFGLWMNYDMYILHFISIVVFGTIIYFLIKDYEQKKLF